MVVECGSPIVGSLDSDCFMLEYCEESVKNIRSGKYDIIYPHNHCIKYNVTSPNFYKKGDDRYLKRTGRSNNNTGGLLFISVDALLKIGMWNESFDCWGGEDSEFYCRCGRLGLSMRRFPGLLYHLNHPKKEGEGFYSNHKEANKDKLKKTRVLTTKELKEEVEKWSWVKSAKKTLNKET